MIAYSTMSQIGYMIMGVSVGAYSAGLFHLMTHAFFKALLFMARRLDHRRDGGQPVAGPDGRLSQGDAVHVRCFIIGGLALSGLPPFSGWLSKDDIIAFLDHRGGGFVILGILGYVGALLTAIYTFRMIFRAFFGDPCPEAVELEHGHLAHADVPTNPMTGEEEDTDVGFPGPEHFIAEREVPMKVAMGTLAVLAVIGGVLQIPGVDDVVTKFLEPTFADSQVRARRAGDRLGLARAGDRRRDRRRRHRDRLPDLGGRPGHSTRVRERFPPSTAFLSHKWYFDELIDFLIVRPALWFGSVPQNVLERVVIAGAITGGTIGLVRAGSAAVRRAQTGFLRYYAAVMVVCVFAVALYFLISAT